MDDFRQFEYVALRATIRERGTVRVVTFLAALVAWAALELAFLASGPPHVVGPLLSLMVLAAGFEAVFQIHLGVERVGRYLQVAFEERGTSVPGVSSGDAALASSPAWETTAMAYGKAYPSAGSDPLFATLFLLATLINALPLVRAWHMPIAFPTLVVAHGLFVLRVRTAKRHAGRQRAEDLVRFRELLATKPSQD